MKLCSKLVTICFICVTVLFNLTSCSSDKKDSSAEESIQQIDTDFLKEPNYGFDLIFREKRSAARHFSFGYVDFDRMVYFSVDYSVGKTGKKKYICGEAKRIDGSLDDGWCYSGDENSRHYRIEYSEEQGTDVVIISNPNKTKDTAVIVSDNDETLDNALTILSNALTTRLRTNDEIEVAKMLTPLE